MGIVFNVPGEQDGGSARRGEGAAAPAAGPLGAVKQAVRVSARRGDGAVVSVVAEPGQDAVLLQLADGPELLLHPDNARDLLRAQAGTVRSRGPGGDEALGVPAQLSWQGSRQGGAARGFGLGEAVLSGFKLMGIDVRGELADLTVDALLQYFDRKPRAELHRLDRDTLDEKSLGEATRLALAPEAPPGAPALVLIHGTFSTTYGTFKHLWGKHPQSVAQLFEAYGGRVYALEHATLSQSPIQNARDLAEALPAGASLHLLTHSRGGLVAEVLARVCAQAAAGKPLTLDEGSADQPRTQPRAEDVEALDRLVALVRDKRLRVERVVRVACPARGTLLASRRLDAYLSVLRWLLDKAALPVAPELVSLLREVARRGLDAEKVPGLAAQMPDSALVRWLHAADAPLAGTLRVVAGDMEGDSITSWLKTLMADAFYWTDNDLVVQTRSMYGGAPRADGAAFVLDRGGEVSHFAYFSNRGTARAIVEALLQERPADFQPIGPLSWAGRDAGGVRAATRAARSGPETARPAVVLLPGIAGSNLKVNGERVWLSGRLINGLLRLAYQGGVADGVAPDGPVSLVYGDLVSYLSRTHEVIEFSFDWRKPIEEEALRLGGVVQEALDARAQSREPVRLLAHSMGGLVARAMQWRCPDVWKQLMSHPGARLLMLGTPNGGSWAPMQVLSGDDTFGNTLTAVGAPFRDDKARAMLAGFPGLMQMQMGLLDPELRLDQAETWTALAKEDVRRVQEFNSWHHDLLQLNVYRWGAPPDEVLKQAVALRLRLDKQRDEDLPRFADRLLLVLGTAPGTPDGFEMGNEGLVYRDAQNEGDGRVLDRSAMLPGVAAWRAGSNHGALPELASAFPAYVELLEKGQTKLLPSVPALGGVRGVVAPVARHVLRRPSREGLRPLPPADDLSPLAPPPSGPGTAAARGEALAVQVFNGDLGFVRHPLLIGHYASLALTGAEAAVDRLLGGSLSRALRTGLYPQELGTQQLFLNTRPSFGVGQVPQPQAVVVLGLGPEGKLRPAALVRAVRSGVLAWALRLAEQPGAPARFELAATLMGSGGMGISAGQAAQLIAQGVREANARLQDDAQDGAAPGAAAAALPQVSRLVLAELYLDRATEAWRALRELQQASPGELVLEEEIERADSALSSPLDSSYRGADYDLIIATAQQDSQGNSTITYRIDTRRARSELQSRKTQGQLLRQLIQDGSAGGPYSRIGRTLFQLLVPLEMRHFLGGNNDTQIELDEGSAGIPWELLETPRDPAGDGGGTLQQRPWAIRTKLLRKLRSEDFRLRVSDAPPDAGVLVIGEPACPRGYARLPGARREARGVLDRLRALGLRGPTVELIASDDETRFGADATTVIRALEEHDWRVIHIAGHGEAPWYGNPPGQTLLDPRGVVLSNGTFLGPREIEGLDVVPELVFVNCCYSGARRTEDVLSGGPDRLGDPGNRPGFAANVAQELIRIGVRCVVATGWAVDDNAAEAFAVTFYTALGRGRRFIDAVAEARLAAWSVRDGGDTWGAYQCYGDPDWRLLDESGGDRRPTRTPDAEFAGIASTPALLGALRALEGEPAYRVPRLRYLEDRFGDRWGGQGRVAEAFGRAFAAAALTGDALRWYRRAVGAEDGGASLGSGEQLHNLAARLAWEQVAQAREKLIQLPPRQGKGDTARDQAEAAVKAAAKEAVAPIEAALEGLELLMRLQRTAERESLCGSACKRLAQVRQALGDDAGTARMLDEMRRHYQAGWDLARSAPNAAAFYPAMNVLAASLVVDAGAGANLDALLEQVKELVAERNRLKPDFWGAAAGIELRLWEALHRGQLAVERERLQAALSDLHDRVSDVLKWRSVHDQSGLVITAFQARRGQKDKGEKEAAKAVLDRLAEWAYPKG